MAYEDLMAILQGGGLSRSRVPDAPPYVVPRRNQAEVDYLGKLLGLPESDLNGSVSQTDIESAYTDTMRKREQAQQQEKLQLAGEPGRVSGEQTRLTDTLQTNQARQKAMETAYGTATGQAQAGVQPNEQFLGQQAHQRKIEELMAPERAKSEGGIGIASIASKTPGGTSYVDLSKFKGEDYHRAQNEAQALGVRGLSQPEAAAMEKLQAVRQNFAEMARSIPKLPSSAMTKAMGAGKYNQLQAYLQTDPDLASWGTYRNDAITALIAIAGGAGSGLRVNQAEIKLSVENDIPEITDTQDTAKAKMSKILHMLDNQERNILGEPAPSSPSAEGDPWAAPPTSAELAGGR